MLEILRSLFSPDFIFAIIRITVPILLAALAALIAQKAGVTNIGLEGIMTLSALFGTLISYWTQSWFIGILGAVIVGVFIASIIAFFNLKLRTDIILAGIAINILGTGGAIFLLYLFTGMRGNTGAFSSDKILIPQVDIPIIKDIPYIGRIVSGHAVLTYFAFILVFLTWLLLYKTPLGLKIRAVGEDSDAAKSVGISVVKIKYIALAFSGAFAGLGGAFMSMYYSQSWNNGIIAGRGFIALAAEAMGKGEPLGAAWSSLLFGLAQALRTKVSGFSGISSYLVSAIPYIVTILGLFLYAAISYKRYKKKAGN